MAAPRPIPLAAPVRMMGPSLGISHPPQRTNRKKTTYYAIQCRSARLGSQLGESSLRGIVATQASSDPQPGAWLLGRVERLGPGRNGLIHLRLGISPGLARPSASLGNSGDNGEHWLLRRSAVRDFTGWLGTGFDLGTCG